MAAAFQSLAFQQAPAFQTGDAPAVDQPTPGNKFKPYPFDEIAREERRQREEARRTPEPVEFEHPLEPEVPESRYPAKRTQQDQRADAERRLFERAQERAEQARAVAEQARQEAAEHDRIALVALQRQQEEAALWQLALNEQAARAFLAFLMELP